MLFSYKALEVSNNLNHRINRHSMFLILKPWEMFHSNICNILENANLRSIMMYNIPNSIYMSPMLSIIVKQNCIIATFIYPQLSNFESPCFFFLRNKYLFSFSLEPLKTILPLLRRPQLNYYWKFSNLFFYFSEVFLRNQENLLCGPFNLTFDSIEIVSELCHSIVSFPTIIGIPSRNH